MEKMYIIEANCETGEITKREYNEKEYAVHQANQAVEATRQAEAEAKAQAKAELLQRLGISEDEAKLLLA